MSSFLRFARGANYKRFESELKKIAAEKKRSVAGLKADFMRCFVLYGTGLTDYLNYKFYDRSSRERKEYVTIRTQDRVYPRINPDQYKKVFSEKFRFLRAFEKYVGRDWFYAEEDTADNLRAFLSRHSVFMEKPCDGLGGAGVHKVRSDEIGDVEEYYGKLKASRSLLEELIVQHEKMSSFSSSSVNTIRVMTATGPEDTEIIFACVRIGRGGDVDNFHAGGMCALVDVETGVIKGNAIAKDGTEYKTHPVSGVQFDGFQIPNWDKVRNICLEAAKIEPRIHTVGWDVAVTEEGAVFVEGNRRAGFDLVQMSSRRGRKDVLKRAVEISGVKVRV